MISIKQLTIGILLAALAACASHRPPECKGPYTPIQAAIKGQDHGE